MGKKLLISLLVSSLAFFSGCEQISSLWETDESTPQAKQPDKKQIDQVSPEDSADEEPDQPGDPKIDALLVQAREALDEGQLPEARKILDQLKQSELTSAQQAQLAELVSELKPRASTTAAAHDHKWHEAQLQAAQEHVSKDQFDQAEVLLRELIRYNPTPAQQKQASEISATIARRRLAISRLQEAVTRLASGSRAEVRQAQNQLFEESASAVPLLLAAVADGKPTAIRNAVETLRILRRPDAALPALVNVLAESKHAELWPMVTAEIQQAGVPGGGEKLLSLALDTELPKQRIAALRALSQVVDPPQRTLSALLQMIYADREELPAALDAATSAVTVHGQHDLVSLRGLNLQLDSHQSEQLVTLPDRLLQIVSDKGIAATSARKLAIAIRVIPAEPLPEVKLLAYSAQVSDGPAASVLDGNFATVDPKRMWRHSVNRRGSIVLDLGQQRTVAGVKLWNLNQPGNTQRGWKEVTIFIGETPAEATRPIAQGVVPQAPGAAGESDYGATIPVAFARGRYVRLDAQSLWSKQEYSGLTEVQVLGF